jgi:hypothetical protein
MDWSTVGPAIAAIVAVIGLAGTFYKMMNSMTCRVTTLEAESRLFWTVLQPHLAQIIHSPNHPRRDYLVDRFNETEMSNAELTELAGLLDLNIKENCDTAKRLASALLLGRVEATLLKRGAPRWRN